MAWLICFALLIGCVWTKDIAFLYASGLFAIAGAIETLAVKFTKK